MKNSYKINETEVKAIRKAMKKTKKSSVYRRLEAVCLLGEGKKPSEISEIMGFHPKYVRILGITYNKTGLSKLATDGRKGGNHRCMNEQEASQFLRGFEEKARNGQIITVEEIAAEFDKVTGKERSTHSTVYYFLHRHDWRMIMPRSRHPKKASDEVIEASKKLTLE